MKSADDLDVEFVAALRAGTPTAQLWQLARESERPISDFADQLAQLFGMSWQQSQDAVIAAAVCFYRSLPRTLTKAERLKLTARNFPMIHFNILERECPKPAGRLYRYFRQ
jgi:hypothetical protein